MSYPNQPGEGYGQQPPFDPGNPYGHPVPPAAGYPAPDQGYPAPAQGYPAQSYPGGYPPAQAAGYAPQYAMSQGYGVDPYAPYGRDPMTGLPLSDKSKVTAGLLQLFFGGFGVGRFYLGSTNIAVTQLVLTLVGWATAIFLIGFVILAGVGIWALVDAIMMFTGSVPDQYGRKLRD